MKMIKNCLKYGAKNLFSSVIQLISGIFTSAKEVMFSPGFVCLSVCLFVNKISQKLMDGF